VSAGTPADEEFDYRSATEAAVLKRADLLEGRRLGDIPGVRFVSSDPRRGRQEVGHAIEAWFGIPRNAMPGPDFPAAGIELKAVPLVRGTNRQLRIKERTVVSLIDYETLAGETWVTASVRKKLKILFVFFEHLLGHPKSEFPIHSVILWEPRGEIEAQIRRDWEAVRQKTRDGRAHELSEADGRILGPCTKGASSASLRRQPFSEVRAMSRAFALKPSFTFALYVEPRVAPLDESDIAESATLSEVRPAFQEFVGRTIESVANEMGVRPSKAKNHAARVVRRAIDHSSPLPAHEFRRIGPTIRVPRVDTKSLPYEAVSFPAFKHIELVEEEWDDSALLSYVEHMLLIPVVGVDRTTPPASCVIGTPVYWEPTPEQMSTMSREWARFRDLIAAGRSADLPTESQTHALHVRPHGRDATDRDPVPGGGTQIKRSFWLNRRFVQEILTAGSG
jgi:DNA mismatch repair endonuclease MutH